MQLYNNSISTDMTQEIIGNVFTSQRVAIFSCITPLLLVAYRKFGNCFANAPDPDQVKLQHALNQLERLMENQLAELSLFYQEQGALLNQADDLLERILQIKKILSHSESNHAVQKSLTKRDNRFFATQEPTIDVYSALIQGYPKLPNQYTLSDIQECYRERYDYHAEVMQILGHYIGEKRLLIHTGQEDAHAVSAQIK